MSTMNLITDENQAIDALQLKYNELNQLHEQKSTKYSIVLTEKNNLELEMEALEGRLEQLASAINMIKGSGSE